LEISNKLQLFGCDINPLANLITQVKLQGVSPNINNDIRDLKLYLKGEFDENYIFPNIDKWFRKDIANELRKIRSAIIKI
jgi:site-specific DNA-methyltransferase (cytosine-N4-specific)